MIWLYIGWILNVLSIRWCLVLSLEYDKNASIKGNFLFSLVCSLVPFFNFALCIVFYIWCINTDNFEKFIKKVLFLKDTKSEDISSTNNKEVEPEHILSKTEPKHYEYIQKQLKKIDETPITFETN